MHWASMNHSGVAKLWQIESVCMIAERARVRLIACAYRLTNVSHTSICHPIRESATEGQSSKCIFEGKARNPSEFGAEVDGVQILRSGQRRGVTRTMKAMIKRRSAIESTIGHMKSDGRLNRNPFKGALGDGLHACGAWHNIRRLLSLLRLFVAHLRAIVLAWLGRSASDYRCQVALAAA